MGSLTPGLPKRLGLPERQSMRHIIYLNRSSHIFEWAGKHQAGRLRERSGCVCICTHIRNVHARTHTRIRQCCAHSTTRTHTYTNTNTHTHTQTLHTWLIASRSFHLPHTLVVTVHSTNSYTIHELQIEEHHVAHRGCMYIHIHVGILAVNRIVHELLYHPRTTNRRASCGASRMYVYIDRIDVLTSHTLLLWPCIPRTLIPFTNKYGCM